MLVGWYCGAATQRRCRALWVHRAADPSSKCVFHHHYVCPSVPTQNERRAGGVEIVYAAWHVRRHCGDVMYVCHSTDGRTDRDNAERTADDIKAPHSTYTICCGLVVGVLYLT